MTQEEKAKRYDEALEIAKKNYVTAQDLCEGSKIGVECFKNTLENIFPELKGKGDERIKEALIALLKFGLEDGSAIAPGFNETKEQALAWLEKQSKHKLKTNPCEKCNHVMLNCHNFPCIEKQAFDQNKTIFDIINKEK